MLKFLKNLFSSKKSELPQPEANFDLVNPDLAKKYHLVTAPERKVHNENSNTVHYQHHITESYSRSHRSSGSVQRQDDEDDSLLSTVATAVVLENLFDHGDSGFQQSESQQDNNFQGFGSGDTGGAGAGGSWDDSSSSSDSSSDYSSSDSSSD